MKEYHVSEKDVLEMSYKKFMLYPIDCPSPDYDSKEDNNKIIEINEEEIAKTADEELLAFGFIKN